MYDVVMGCSPRSSGGCYSEVERGLENTLPALVNDYLGRYGRESEDQYRRFKNMRSLAEAIVAGAGGRTADDKCEPHQRRIGARVLAAFARHVLEFQKPIRQCRTFEELHDLIHAHRLSGIGPLAVYDTAARIGGFLRLRPRFVHLHAGTRQGAAALGLPVDSDRLSIEQLPRPLRQLTASQVEDFLCIYKDSLRGVSFGRGVCDRSQRRVLVF